MKIAVFCGSREGKNPRYKILATKLGESIALLGHTVIYGGSDVGCMGAVADGAVSKGGDVIGIIPAFLAELEPAHMGITKLYTVHDMATRKAMLIDMSDAFIVLPGGYGTMDEFFEIVTLKVIKQLGDKPIALVNAGGFYDHLIYMMKVYMEAEDFTHADMDKLFTVTENVVDTLGALGA